MRAKFMMIYDQFCFAFESCNACLLFLFRNSRIFFSRSFVRFLLHGICVFGFRVHELIFSLSRWHKHIFCLYDQFWCFLWKCGKSLLLMGTFQPIQNLWINFSYFAGIISNGKMKWILIQSSVGNESSEKLSESSSQLMSVQNSNFWHELVGTQAAHSLSIL